MQKLTDDEFGACDFLYSALGKMLDKDKPERKVDSDKCLVGLKKKAFKISERIDIKMIDPDGCIVSIGIEGHYYKRILFPDEAKLFLDAIKFYVEH